MNKISDMSSKAKARARKALAEKHGWICHYCEAKLIPDEKWDDFSYCEANGYFFPQLDHKTPRALGGSNSIENLVLSCRKCNRGKSAMTEQEYISLRTA